MSDFKLESFPYTQRKLEKFFEDAFVNNQFQLLFPEEKYKKIVAACFDGMLSEEWFLEFDEKKMAKGVESIENKQI